MQGKKAFASSELHLDECCRWWMKRVHRRREAECDHQLHPMLSSRLKYVQRLRSASLICAKAPLLRRTT